MTASAPDDASSMKAVTMGSQKKISSRTAENQMSGSNASDSAMRTAHPGAIKTERRRTPSSHGDNRFKPNPPGIDRMLAQGRGVKLLEVFDAGSGLTGYVLSAITGERRIFYATEDGKTLMLGLMFDEHLNNVTADHQVAYMDVTEFLHRNGATNALLSSKDEASAFLNSMTVAASGNGKAVFAVVDPSSALTREIVRKSLSISDYVQFHWILAIDGKPGDISNPDFAAEISSLVHAAPVDQTLKIFWEIVGVKAPARAMVNKSTTGAKPTASQTQSGLMRLREMIPGMKLPLILHHDKYGELSMIMGMPSQHQWNSLAQQGREMHEAREFMRKRAARRTQ